MRLNLKQKSVTAIFIFTVALGMFVIHGRASAQVASTGDAWAFGEGAGGYSSHSIQLTWRAGDGATGYNIYRSVGVNDVNQAVLIASNIPTVNPIPNPVAANLPDPAFYDSFLTGIYPPGGGNGSGPQEYYGTYYDWHDITASAQDYNYYWVQSVGAGTGLKSSFGGIRAGGNLPTLYFTGNGSQNSVTVPYGNSLNLYVSALGDETSCTASLAWTGNKQEYFVQSNQMGRFHAGVYIAETIPNITANGDYVITCTGPTSIDGFTPNKSAMLQVTVESAAPTADIKANNSDGPVSIAYNSPATISWTSTNATSCTVTPGNWSGTSGSQASPSLTTTTTYTLNCSGPGGNVSDTVTVNVSPQSPPSVTANNSTCGQITINWGSSAGNGPITYNVYRNVTSNPPGSPIASGLSSVTYTDTTGNGGSGYYYWVAAVNSAGTSAYTPASLNPITYTACQANLGDSDMDIVSLNSSAIPATNKCDGSTGFEIYPNPAVVFKTGDIVTFGLNLCNDQGQGDANNTSFTSQLVSYIRPSGGWNVRINGVATTTDFTVVSGSSPNQKLMFPLGKISAGAVTTIYFDAQLAHSSTNSKYLRTQNNVRVTYDTVPGSATVYSITTPLLLSIDPTHVSPFPLKTEVAQ